jgi:hypothetical protein
VIGKTISHYRILEKPGEGGMGVVNKALEKDRALRYQSAADLCSDLKRLRRDSSTDGVALTQPPAAAASRLRRRRVLKTAGPLTALLLVAIVVRGLIEPDAPAEVEAPGIGIEGAAGRILPSRH